VNGPASNELTLDALVFIMLRCLRAFNPYSDEHTVLGNVLSTEGARSSADIWQEAVCWGVREQEVELNWSGGKEWLEESVRELARKILEDAPETPIYRDNHAE
jgi:hypothetical protein